MSKFKILDYKQIDSESGVKRVIFQISRYIDFHTIESEFNTDDFEKLETYLDISIGNNIPIYVRAKLIGSNGESEWFLLEEDLSKNTYVFKDSISFTKYDVFSNGDIVNEIIYNPNGDTIHFFNFEKTDKVIYINKINGLSLKKEINFYSESLNNKKWSYINNGNSEYGVYKNNIETIVDETLNIRVINKNDLLLTSNLKYNIDENLNNKYMEFRLNIENITNVKQFININNDINIFENTNNTCTILGEDITIPYLEFVLVGLYFKNGKINIFINHVLKTTIDNIIGLDLNNIEIGNTLLSDNLLESNFKLNYIKLYEF